MTGRVVATAYVVTVAALTAYAFSSNDDHWPAEIAAAVLALPLVVPALPFIYVAGGLAWNVSDADRNGPMWPVTLTFTALMGLVACGNVLLLHAVRSHRQRARG